MYRFRINLSVSAALLPLIVCLGLSLCDSEFLRAQDPSLEAFRKLQTELRDRMDADLQDAVSFLDSKIAANPDSEDHNVLRYSLASRFAEDREYQQAVSQFRMLLDFYLTKPGESRNAFGAWMTIQSLKEVTDRSGEDAELQAAVQNALQAFAEAPIDTNPELLLPLSQLNVLKAQLMVETDETEAAKELVEQQLQRLSDLNDSRGGSEDSMTTYVRVLRGLAGDEPGNDPWRESIIDRLDKVTQSAIAKYPESATLQADFAETQLMMIANWKQDDPEATKKRIDDVSKQLSRLALRNRSVKATLRRIDLYRERIESAKPVASLVGKPAPEWDIDAWVNVIEMDREALEGKVVLLDFWAMWCGPCIATFPHLKEWQEEFGDRGFEIVGVTQYYNFQWNEENKRASRATEDVPPEEERQTIASFLKHHDLEHPVVVTPEGSSMQSEYAVRGIPHVVLIDRDGVVQFVKTGAGKTTADEIRAKIKAMLDQDAPN